MLVMGWSFEVGYSIIDRLGVDVSLPLRLSNIQADFLAQDGAALPSGTESIHHRDETLVGIGDLKLQLLGGVLRAGELGDLIVDIGVGVAFPTGETEEDPFARGRAGLEHQHVFFGGGTFRPTVSLSAVYPFEYLTLTLFGDAELSLYSGENDYTPPSLISAGLGAQSGFGLTSWRFILSQEVFHEVAARWGDTRAENSGRTDLIATVGAAWLATPNVNLSLMVRVPYYTFQTGDSISVPIIFALSINANLDTQD